MKVSIIIPAYNCENYIAQTLAGIYGQTMARSDMEIIVCLDAPTDGTADVVRTWAAAHPDIKTHVIENTENRGVSYSRNAAVRVARGEFIHFMDSDDFINADFYQALYNAAVRTGADVAVASFKYQRQPHNSVVFDMETVVANPQDRVDVVRTDAHGMMWRYLVRRMFWEAHNFEFPEDVRFCEDWLLANQMIQTANMLVTVPGAVYEYMCRDNSLMMRVGRDAAYAAAGENAARAVDAFLAENNLRPHLRAEMVMDWRLFGGVRIVTVAHFAGGIMVRLFGKWTLFKVTRNYKYIRGRK